MIPTSNRYFDLGSFSRPIANAASEAQIWFDRGLIWTYAFNHEEAAYCFEQAIAHDPDCAMAYWGLAYTSGPNYNKPWELFEGEERSDMLVQTHQAAITASQKCDGATHLEKLLIQALKLRYPDQSSADDFSGRNQKYAQAMKGVYDSFPDDLDVAALYADSLMNLTPWQLWDITTGKPALDARTLEAQSVLERAIAQEGGIRHPGLLHLYIHLVEMSPRPEVGMRAADALRGLVPAAGHLQHMPTHLDILCGNYGRAMASNFDAIRADNEFFTRNSPKKFYTLYRCHNYHFRIYAAMLAGKSRVALETVDQLEACLPEDLLRTSSPPMADWLEGFLSVRVHVLIRFGRWKDLIDIVPYQDQKLYCVTTAMQYYGRSLAMAATGRLENAIEEHKIFAQAANIVPESRTIFNNTCRDILRVAEAMLNSEIEYRRGNYDDAFNAFREAIARDDSLPYDEPWGWMQPTRHAYGALLLEQGHVEDAAQVYRADLGLDNTLPRPLRHLNNVWSLHGYNECLVRLGRHEEAAAMRTKLTTATDLADMSVESSCFCRNSIQPR